MKFIQLVSFCCLFSSQVFAQNILASKFGKGLSFTAKDSSFAMKFSTRFQTLYDGQLNIETDKWSDKLLIRRARLKFDGFAYNPKLVYKIELAISNRDNGKVAPENNQAANIVLDAVLKYKFAKGWQLWFGQTKLPGNRERVISSQNLQFVDRSQLNSKFTLDRGSGFQLRHSHTLFGKGILKEIGSISMGEGRNITASNVGGYELTGRIEYLPFGEFTSKGDYFGSDLKREKEPKLSIAFTYDQNNNTSRVQGFKGTFLETQKDLKTVFIDAMFKYKGFSSMFEYADKRTDGSPLAPNGSFYTGTGVNFQMGYLFKNNFEIAGRYTGIAPENITGNEGFSELTLGLSRYIVGHNLKVQSDMTYIDNDVSDDAVRLRFQVELAF